MDYSIFQNLLYLRQLMYVNLDLLYIYWILRFFLKAHYSVARNAAILGIGLNQVRKVPVDERLISNSNFYYIF